MCASLYSCEYMLCVCSMYTLRLLRLQTDPASTSLFCAHKSNQLWTDRSSVRSWAREAVTGEVGKV